MKKIFKGMGLGLALLSVVGLFYYFQIRNFTPGNLIKQKSIHYSNTPTLFIHGYQGNRFSFGPLLKNLETGQYAKREMTISVTKNGKLKVTGSLKQNRNNPTILLLFENNTADEVTQSQWIDKVMRSLRKKGVTEINIVAHSMGGVSALRYMIEYEGSREPATKKFIAIATPFNDLEIAEETGEVFASALTANGPDYQTPIYEYFDQQMNYLPKGLKVLNVAGDLEDGSASDGSVSLQSVFSLRYLLQKHVASYQETTIKGRLAGHSLLTKTGKLQRKLIQFLW